MDKNSKTAKSRLSTISNGVRENWFLFWETLLDTAIGFLFVFILIFILLIYLIFGVHLTGCSKLVE